MSRAFSSVEMEHEFLSVSIVCTNLRTDELRSLHVKIGLSKE